MLCLEKCAGLSSTLQQRASWLPLAFWFRLIHFCSQSYTPKILSLTSPPPSFLTGEKLCRASNQVSLACSSSSIGSISNLKRKKWWKESSKVPHNFFTMGVLNTVLSINEHLECSPLALSSKRQRCWDIPEPGLCARNVVSGRRSHPSSEDLLHSYGAEVRGIQREVFTLLLPCRIEK